MTHIVNQDRDRIHPVRYDFHPVPVFSDGVLIAYNLMMGRVPLGTFDDAMQTVEEIGRLLHAECEVGVVRGYGL